MFDKTMKLYAWLYLACLVYGIEDSGIYDIINPLRWASPAYNKTSMSDKLGQKWSALKSFFTGKSKDVSMEEESSYNYTNSMKKSYGNYASNFAGSAFY